MPAIDRIHHAVRNASIKDGWTVTAPGVETLLVFDTERDHYLWLQVGWTERGRTYGTTVHVRLREGKIVIEQDWTEDGIAIDLLRAGVPAEAIVLGFHEPAVGQELSGVILLGR